MRKIVIIRFGVEQPLPKEMPIIEKFADMATATGAPFGSMGVISLIETNAMPNEIATEFKRVADETGDVLPVIVFELGESATIEMSAIPGLMEWINEFHAKSETPATKGCTLSLDELLDLVQQKGLQNLSTEEVKRLEKLSSEF